MSELEWSTVPELRQPLLVLALRGLFDAGGAATGTVKVLQDRWPGARLAGIDPEGFFDFQQERPQIRLRPDGGREIVWPTNDFRAGPTQARHDLVTCAGVEPHLRWRTFCSYVLELARRSGTAMVVTLGAMVGLVPHTRPLPVTGSATNRALAERLGLGSPTYEGPTGVVGALHELLDDAGVPVISLRVAVPHYVPAPPNAKATRALLARFEQVTRIPTGFELLGDAADEWARQVDAAAADDPDVVGYVRRLEEQFDAEAPLPSGDDLAAELEAFLREQRDDEG